MPRAPRTRVGRIPRINRLRGGRVTSTVAAPQQFAFTRARRELIKSASALTKIAEFTPTPASKDRWQVDAYSFAETIGEVGYVMHLTANTAAKCRLRPLRREMQTTDDGVTVRVETDTHDERVWRVLDGLVGPRGGDVRELIRVAALHLQIAGEAYLVGSPVVGLTVNGFVWEFLSMEEVRNDRGHMKRLKWGNGSPEEVDLNGYVARMHRPDPRFSELADSPLKRVRTICREVVLLTQVVDAVAKARLSAGILFMPWELSWGPLQEWENPQSTTDDVDPFEEALIEHMKAPVEDRASAASLVPLLMRGPAHIGSTPTMQLMGLVDITRDLDEQYQSLRREALERLGAGLDIPPEVMGGKGGLNHWTGYSVDADFIGRHVVPVGQLIADFLTSAYLRPMLVTHEGMTQEEAEKFRLEFDSSPITSRADSGPVSRAAYDRRAVSLEAYLRANGLDPADRPTDDETKVRILTDLLLSNPLRLAPVILPLLYPGDPALEKALAEWPEDGPLSEDQGGDVQGKRAIAPPGPERGDEADPDPDGAPTERGPNAQSLQDRLADIGVEHLERALRDAGAKLRERLVADNPEMAARVVDVPDRDLLSAVSVSGLEELGLDAATMFTDVWDGLKDDASTAVQEWLLKAGHPASVASEQAVEVATQYAELTALLAQSVVHRGLPPDPGPVMVNTATMAVDHGLSVVRLPRQL